MGSSTISNPPLCSCGVTENPHPGNLPFRFRSMSSFSAALSPRTLHSPILGFYLLPFSLLQQINFTTNKSNTTTTSQPAIVQCRPGCSPNRAKNKQI